MDSIEENLSEEEIHSEDDLLLVNLEERKKVQKNKRKTNKKWTPFKCKICSKHFTDKYLLNAHVAIHSTARPFACQQCPYTCKTKKYLARHVKNVHTPPGFQCQQCGKKFNSKEKLETHTRVHTGEKPFECRRCGKCFSARYSLKTHMYLHTDEKPFKCKYCSYACRDSSTLRKHQQRHLGIKSIYQCKTCGQEYKQKYSLKNHVAEVHLSLDINKHKCEDCGKMFRSKNSLSSHKRVHDKSSQCKCELCGAILKNKDNLKCHMRTHVDARPFTCSHAGCGKTFKDSCALQKHEIIHKPSLHFPCEICGRTFSRYHRLVKHIDVHAPQTKCVECDYCGVRFLTKNYLIKHIRQKHARKRQKFKCDMCAFVTHNKPSIVMHVKYAHARCKSNQCDICGKKFNKMKYLNDHCCKYHGIKHFIPKPKMRKPTVAVKIEPVDEPPFEIKQEIPDELTVQPEDILPYEDEEPSPQETQAKEVISSHSKKLSKVPEELFDEFYIEKFEGQDLDKKRKHMPDPKIAEEAMVTLRKMVAERRQREELRTLERTRQQYNERMRALLNSFARKQDKLKIKHFDPNKSSTNENADSTDKPVDEESLNNNDSNSDENVKENGVYEEIFKINDLKDKASINNTNIDNNKTPEEIDEDISKTYNNDLPEEIDEDVSNNHKAPKEIDEDVSKYDNNISPEEIDEDVSKTDSHKYPEEIDEDVFMAVNIKSPEEIDKNVPKTDTNMSPEEIDENVSMADIKSPEERDEDVSKADNTKLPEEVDEVLSKSDTNMSQEEMNEDVSKDDNNMSPEEIDEDVSISGYNPPPEEMNENVSKSDDNKAPEEKDEDVSMADNNPEEIDENVFKAHNNKAPEDIDEDVPKNDSHKAPEEIEDASKADNNKVPEVDENVSNTDESNDDEGDEDWVGNESKKDKCKKSGKVKFNTHQCYICFKLYDTKEKLVDHCKDHFDVCNNITLNKCPLCEYVTKKEITKHLRLVHNVNIKLPFAQIKDKKDNTDGSRYYYEINNEKFKKIEIIPSIRNLNKLAQRNIEKKDRETKNMMVAKTKLVKKGKDWIVERENMNISKEVDDHMLPEVSEKDIIVREKKLKIGDVLSDKYVDRLKRLYKIMKKKGKKMLFPCLGCEKICQTASALKLHERKHDTNPKPFKPKVWKHKFRQNCNNTIKSKNGRISKPIKVIDEVCVKQPKLPKKENPKSHREAKPKPIVNKHKCDPQLKEFYEKNIRGGNIEFWQFLKIFNKMGREKINDFKDLEQSSDFGIHFSVDNEIDNKVQIPNSSNEIESLSTVVNVTKESKKTKKLSNITKCSKRVIRRSKAELRRRKELKDKLREKIATEKTNTDTNLSSIGSSDQAASEASLAHNEMLNDEMPMNHTF